jgi:hypothetical protein
LENGPSSKHTSPWKEQEQDSDTGQVNLDFRNLEKVKMLTTSQLPSSAPTMTSKQEFSGAWVQCHDGIPEETMVYLDLLNYA